MIRKKYTVKFRTSKPVTKPVENNIKKGFNILKSATIRGILLAAVPAYVYFFGYYTFRYQLEAIGFSSPQISPSPGEVYFHAFNAYFFCIIHYLPQIKTLTLEMLLPYIKTGIGVSFTIGICVYAYLLMESADKKYTKAYTDSEHGRIMKWKAIGISAIATTITAVAQIIAIPFIIIVGSIISIALMPPLKIASDMAKLTIQENKCPDTVEKITSETAACAIITTSSGKTFIGSIHHVDDKFLYVLTKDSAESIPIKDITNRQRKIFYSKTVNR